MYHSWNFDEVKDMKRCMKEILKGRNVLAHNASEVTEDQCKQMFQNLRHLVEMLGMSDSVFISHDLDWSCVHGDLAEVKVMGIDRSAEKVRIPIDVVRLHGRTTEMDRILDFLSGKYSKVRVII